MCQAVSNPAAVQPSNELDGGKYWSVGPATYQEHSIKISMARLENHDQVHYGLWGTGYAHHLWKAFEYAFMHFIQLGGHSLLKNGKNEWYIMGLHQANQNLSQQKAQTNLDLANKLNLPHELPEWQGRVFTMDVKHHISSNK